MAGAATIVIDMLNPYDHEDGETLAERVRSCIEPLQALIAATPEADAELIYVKDAALCMMEANMRAEIVAASEALA
jgi:hypothetical protein